MFTIICHPTHTMETWFGVCKNHIKGLSNSLESITNKGQRCGLKQIVIRQSALKHGYHALIRHTFYMQEVTRIIRFLWKMLVGLEKQEGCKTLFRPTVFRGSNDHRQYKDNRP